MDEYLTHLGCAKRPGPTLQTLRDLHRRHLSRVQYDTLHALRINPDNMADMDLDDTFDNVVLGAQGGMCLQLNTLFERLLAGLGFRTTVVAGGTWIPGNVFYPDPEHMLTLVDLDGDRWLAAVGPPGGGGTRPPGPPRAPERRTSPHWYTTTLSPFRTCAYRSAIAPSSRTLTQPWEAPA
ncbi:arylamine N-acetyltransferase [Streptomyces olivaceus]|uniref:arylamine N-acetyltransferase n=1 Tax=Streptomyces olivaceus TaxID=47716 RepID=UPI0040578089